MTDTVEKEEFPEIILGIAIKVIRRGTITSGETIFKLSRPSRHENLKNAIIEQLGLRNPTIIDKIEGFYSNKRKFLTRAEAMTVVKAQDDFDSQFNEYYRNSKESWVRNDTDMQSIYLW